MKKRILISICAFILCFTGGCSNDNSEGNKNELGNYIASAHRTPHSLMRQTAAAMICST